MRGPRLRRGAVSLAILAGSQLGHAIVYYARFGAAAAGGQATGVHAYFPAVTGVLSAVLGSGMLAILLAVAAVRSLAPRPAHRLRSTTRFFDLLPVLFAAQVLVFVGQELIESVAAGGPVPSVVELVFWATLGQLPAATLASVALAWLLTRLESVWTTLVDGIAEIVGEPWTTGLARPLRHVPAPALQLASAAPAAFLKRGPPLCSDR